MNYRKHSITIIFALALVIAGLIFNSTRGEKSNAEQRQLFEQANQSYQKEQFPEAISKYQELINQEFHSANVYNNLANAYSRIGDVGNSILYYEKALQADYYDSDIRNNLSAARKNSANYQNIEFGYWGKLVGVLSITHWAVLAGLSVLGLCVFFVLKQISFFKPSVLLQVGMSLCVIGFVTLSIFAIQFHKEKLKGRAIVLAKDSTVRVSPFKDANEVAVLQPGKVITVLPNEIHDGFAQVKLDTGKNGWLEISHYESVKLSNK